MQPTEESWFPAEELLTERNFQIKAPSTAKQLQVPEKKNKQMLKASYILTKKISR